jgi:transposase
MLLLAVEGLSISEVAAECHVSPTTVKLWTSRFQRDGLMTLQRDAPGRGRRRAVDLATFLDRLRDAQLLDAEGRPISLRRAAAVLGVSASAVWRALQKSPPAKSYH